jgi:hypothetical protein
MVTVPEYTLLSVRHKMKPTCHMTAITAWEPSIPVDICELVVIYRTDARCQVTRVTAVPFG